MATQLQEKVVVYMGLSDVRLLSEEDLKMIGIEDPEGDIRWNRQNNWTIPVKDLPDQVVEYCQHDHELVVKTR